MVINEQTQRFYGFGEFLVDAEKRQLFRDGDIVQLTPKVFDTLLVFLSEKNRVLEKNELMERLWADSFVEEANLVQNVSTLRKALGESSRQNKFIVTIPGRGYRFVAPVRELPDEQTDLIIEEKTRTQITIEDSQPETAPVIFPPKFARKVFPKNYLFAVLGLIIFMSAVLSGVYPLRPASMSQASADSGDSLAILPFANSDGNQESEYFGDGLTDSLINRFSSLESLRITSRSTAFRYKNKELSPTAAGLELGVKTVLTGSITQRGDLLRIQTELIDVRRDAQLWGQTYEVKVSEILSAQDEISRQITEKMQLRLSNEDKQKLTRHQTDNPEAFRLYLKGRYFWNKRNEAGFKRALDFYRQALDLDPTYALAYAGIADAYASLRDYEILPTAEAVPRAKTAAQKALEIDESLAEAHTTLAHLAHYYEWDFAAAERSYRRAIELKPNYATAHQWFALFLSSRSRHDEAIAEIRRAQELDSLSPIINANVAFVYFFARESDAAIRQADKTLQTDPNCALALVFQAMAYEQKGMHREANAAFRRQIEILQLENTSLLWRSEALLGKTDEARAGFDRLLKTKTISPLYQALVLTALGEEEKAIEALEKAVEQRDGWMIYLAVDSRFDPLRKNPRFQQLQQRVGLTK